MNHQVRSILKSVEPRLSEVLEAFHVHRSFSEFCNDEVSPARHREILQFHGLWNPIFNSLQTTYITGIYALADAEDKRQETASLWRAATVLGRPSTDPGLRSVKSELQRISTFYKEFRNKLFAHNDIRRDSFSLKFDASGMTWTSLQGDLDSLEYAFKWMFAACAEDELPDQEKSKMMQFPYNDSFSFTVAHTSRFIEKLAS